MTPQEYEQYTKSVNEFFEKEGIQNLSSGYHICPDCGGEWQDDDTCECGQNRQSIEWPFISSSPCDCCGDSLQGNREHATGWNPDLEQVQEYEVCEDCVYFAEHGQLDDMTMIEIDNSKGLENARIKYRTMGRIKR